MLQNKEKGRSATGQGLNLESQLQLHGFRPGMSLLQAEAALANQPPYTYLVRPSETGRGFGFSYVQKNGHVKHDHFRLLIPRFYIFMNGCTDHVGPLAKVVRDMMNCSMDVGQPL